MTEEQLSNFGEQSWEWTCGPSSGHDGGIVNQRRVVSLLGVDDKRGSNRGNDKIVVVTVAAQARRSLSTCLTLTTRGEATGQGRRRGGRVAAAVAQAQRLLSACLASRLMTRGWVSRLATGGNRRAQPAHTPGRCAIEIGVMVLATDAQGHPEW